MRSAFPLLGALILLTAFVASAVHAKPKARAGKAVPHVPPSSGAAGGVSGNDGDFVTEKRGDTTFKYKKKTTYDFEGASIDGIYNKPSGSYISNIKDVKARSIIRIRENFDPEVNDSARLVK